MVPLMNAILLGCVIALTALVLVLGFLVIGTLRALGGLTWRLDQLELTRSSRLGRDGLKVGKKAPGFTLPCITGSDVSLRDSSPPARAFFAHAPGVFVPSRYGE
jgi:hypothetical protein